MNKKQHKSLLFDNFNDFCTYFHIEHLQDSKYFNTATTHSSINKKNCYERLEFLGDTILNFCISEMLFHKYSSANEGLLSKKKSYLISRKVCRQVAKDICLEQQIKYSKKSSIKNIEFLSADVIESMLCAIYFEFGIKKTHEIVCALFEYYDNNGSDDPKMTLQEYSQKKYQTLPKYYVINQDGTENEPIFTVMVELNSYKSIGIGKTKKIAEKQAADNLLKQIKDNK